MSTWKSLLAGCCLLLAPTLSGAASDYGNYSGSFVVVIGTCTVSPSPGEQLRISNIGPSGLDGVDVLCPHLDGVRCPLTATVSDADNGSSCSLSYRWALVSQPAGSRATLLSVAVTPGHVVYTPTFASVTAAASSGLIVNLRTRLMLGGQVVYDASSTSAQSSHTPPTVLLGDGSSRPVGALSCYLDRSAHTECCAVEFPSTVQCVLDGGPISCDRILLEADLDGDGYGDDASLRITAPPGSSLSSVTLDGLDVSALGQFVRTHGTVEVHGEVVTGQRRLKLHNLGSSGLDRLWITALPSHGVLAQSSGSSVVRGAVDMRFAHPSLSWTAPGDDGASSVTRVHGSSSVLPDGVLATQAISMVGGSFSMQCDFSGIGADAESVVVENQGVEVLRTAVAPGSSVVVTSPPESPPGMAINEKGLPGDKPRKKTASGRAPASVPRGPGPMTALSPGAPDELPFVLGFRSPRIFVVGGQVVTGDKVYCWALRSTDTGGSLRVTAQEEVITTGSSSSSQHDLEILDLDAAETDVVSADVPPSTALSSAHTCVSVPFVIHRTNTTPARAYSVTFHVSPELAQCGIGVAEGDYLSSIGPTQMLVTPNGGGSFTVDCGSVGSACGATGDGLLFSLEVAAVQPVTEATGEVTVDAVRLRDCSNTPIATGPGGTGYVPIDFVAPPALTGLSAIQVLSGNPPGGTTGVLLSWPAPAELDAEVSVYRKGFGNYPEYDNGSSPGSVPPPPATRAGALAQGWTLADPGNVDRPFARDFYYYCAFVTDVFGNTSPVSAETPGTLDYHLGDVSDGITTCAGDDAVDVLDMTFLGSHYGQSVSSGSPYACLDVGPTTDYSTHARPTTDGKIEFEDFVMFAINYLVVSSPSIALAPAPAAFNAARLVPVADAGVGSTFDVGVNVDAAGDAQAMSVRFDYDHSMLEQVRVSAGDLLAAQARPGVVLSSGPGDVDIALLGAGASLSGSGDLARVTFRVKAAGEPHLRISAVSARDARNLPIPVAGFEGGTGVTGGTGLGFAFPDPFRNSTNVRFSLREACAATLDVYDVAGRRVRALVRGIQPAGARTAAWDGRDDSGVRLAPGAYIVRLEAGGIRESRIVRLVR